MGWQTDTSRFVKWLIHTLESKQTEKFKTSPWQHKIIFLHWGCGWAKPRKTNCPVSGFKHGLWNEDQFLSSSFKLNRNSQNRIVNSELILFCVFIKDFVRLCLKHDPKQRPTAYQLLFHPLLIELHTLKLLSVHRFLNSVAECDGNALSIYDCLVAFPSQFVAILKLKYLFENRSPFWTGHQRVHKQY